MRKRFLELSWAGSEGSHLPAHRSSRSAPFARRLLAALCAAAAVALAAAAQAPADTLLIANSGSDTVTVFDTVTDAVVGAPIPVGDEPSSIVIAAGGRRAYVANQGSDTVTVINIATQSTVGAPIHLPELGTLAASPDGKRVFAMSGSFVKTIDTATSALEPGGIHELAFPSAATGIALTPNGRQLWVAHTDPNNFVLRHPTDGSLPGSNAPITNLGSGSGPRAIAFTPDGSRAYVVSETGAGAFPISVATGAASTAIATGAEAAQSIAISPDGTRAFVPAYDNNADIFRLNLQTNALILPQKFLPSGPNRMTAAAYTPDGKRVYVAGGLPPDPAKVVPLSAATGDPIGSAVDVGVGPSSMVAVPDDSPVARLTGPATAVAGVPVQFSAGGSTDADGAIKRFDWSFGDGTAAANGGPQRSHAFAPGSYSVRVTATDNVGCSASPRYTGQTPYCAGAAAATVTRQLVVAGITIGTPKKNKRKGTAAIPVRVPAGGELGLSGKGLAPQHATATAAGRLTLNVKAKGLAKRKLKKKGKLTVNPVVAFTPTGGSTQSQSLTVKLKRKRHSS